MTRTLLWKEWRENRWKTAFGCVLLMGFAWIGLRSRILPDEGIFAIAILGGSLLLAVFSAAGVIAHDREEGSLPHLLAHPAPPNQILTAKLLIGYANISLPLAGAMAVCLLLAGGREFPLALTMWGFAMGFWIGLNVLIWATAFGFRQQTEGRAALAGVFVVTAWILYMSVLEFSVHHSLERWLWAPSPFGCFAWLDNLGAAAVWKTKTLQLLVYLVVQTGILVVLWRWTLSRLSHGNGRLAPSNTARTASETIP